MTATDWKEIIPEDEAARFERHAAFMGELQRKRAVGASLGRALHVKANLGLEAEFEVLADIPAEARVGMFATPRTYRGVARFSNGAARPQSDRKLDVRGLAVKLFGVDGPKLIPGLEDATTQDFLAIRTSVVPMRDADEFIALVRANAVPALLPVRLIGSLGLRRGLGLIKAALAGLKAPQLSLAATSFYSALPIALGPYAVQFAFAARESGARLHLASPTQLGDEMATRLREGSVSYDFQIRFYTDPASTPIEDASVEWSSPWQPIGRLTLPKQDPDSPRGRKVTAFVESLGFDPWKARTDMRPLGNIMRARKVAYRTSTIARNSIPDPHELPSFE
jgi:hypothetical protein